MIFGADMSSSPHTDNKKKDTLICGKGPTQGLEHTLIAVRLDANVCNNKQCWNDDKCRCECKELIGKGNVIRDLFGILVTVNVNVINHVILENI